MYIFSQLESLLLSTDIFADRMQTLHRQYKTDIKFLPDLFSKIHSISHFTIF